MEGLFESGATITANYTWESESTYQVKVKTLETLSTDINRGTESEWSGSLSVSMPNIKSNINTPFLQIMENHLHLFPLLQQIFRLQLKYTKGLSETSRCKLISNIKKRRLKRTKFSPLNLMTGNEPKHYMSMSKKANIWHK